MSLLRPASLALALVPFALLGLGGCTPAEPTTPSSENTGGSPGKTGGSGGNDARGGSGGNSNSGGTGGGSGGNATGGAGNASGGAGGGSGGSGGATGGGAGGGSGGAGGGGNGSGGAGGGGTDAAPSTDTVTPPSERFSFFVTSYEAIQRLSKTPKGFGGDLRYGEADGVSGADKICTEIAESVVPGSGAKGWRAFLSAAKGPGGMPVNAIDRVGEGPWYDRKGRLLAMTKADLANPGNRPRGANPMIVNDFPNEHGINNSHPVVGGPEIDNHHFLTGSTREGKLMGTNTCDSWTTTMTTPTSRPQIGFSFVIQNRAHWISGQTEGGCGAGVDLDGGGGSNPNNPVVGSGGGYGGWYCFALKP